MPTILLNPPFQRCETRIEPFFEALDGNTRLLSPNIADAANGITTFSFDFHEPSSGGNGAFIFGFATRGADLNTAGGYVRFTLDDGTIESSTGGFTTTGTTSYSLDTSFTLHDEN